MYYEHVLNSIDKAVGIPITEKFYNAGEVKDLLKSVLSMLDHTLFEEYIVERK